MEIILIRWLLHAKLLLEIPTITCYRIPSHFHNKKDVLKCFFFWRVCGSRVQRILATGSSSRTNKLAVAVLSYWPFILTAESFAEVDSTNWLWSIKLTRSWTKETSSWRTWSAYGSNTCKLTLCCWPFSCKSFLFTSLHQIPVIVIW